MASSAVDNVNGRGPNHESERRGAALEPRLAHYFPPNSSTPALSLSLAASELQRVRANRGRASDEPARLGAAVRDGGRGGGSSARTGQPLARTSHRGPQPWPWASRASAAPARPQSLWLHPQQPAPLVHWHRAAAAAVWQRGTPTSRAARCLSRCAAAPHQALDARRQHARGTHAAPATGRGAATLALVAHTARPTLDRLASARWLCARHAAHPVPHRRGAGRQRSDATHSQHGRPGSSTRPPKTTTASADGGSDGHPPSVCIQWTAAAPVAFASAIAPPEGPHTLENYFD
eukprot:scaffold139738_cov30-Tisochrysis_lutea.AAC.1